MDITSADIVGSIGVSLLLAAFALNLSGRLETGSLLHSGLNMLGAGLAALASALIPYWPFVVLEGAWCIVSIVALVRAVRGHAT
jgi:hypothetical protein